MNIVFRHPDHPTGPTIGYYSVVIATGSELTVHFYEDVGREQALAAACACADRNASESAPHPTHVKQWEQGWRDARDVYTGTPISHDLRPTSQAVGSIDRSGSTIVVKRNGVYRQEDA